MMHKFINLLFILALYIPNVISQSQMIMVGGSDGWVVKPNNAEYEDIEANVGDIIHFIYSSFYHDVVLLDNDNCDFTNGQILDETGNFQWIVPGPGTYIFACGREDHCSSGNQQVKVISSELNNNDDCIGDLDGDRLVDVNDLLSILSEFGKIC